MAKYQIEVNYGNLPKNAEVEIPGLGVFLNGSSMELSDAQVSSFRAYYGYKEALEDGSPGEWVQGPTPLQAFATQPGVNVTTVGNASSDTSDKKPDDGTPPSAPVVLSSPGAGSDGTKV